MSNHKGGGMASKERLYELWMLYYTKVSASAEDLAVTPVVAAGHTVSTFRLWQERTRRFAASFVLKAYLRRETVYVFMSFYSSSCLFTEQRRLCFALPLWISAS